MFIYSRHSVAYYSYSGEDEYDVNFHVRLTIDLTIALQDFALNVCKSIVIASIRYYIHALDRSRKQHQRKLRI